MFVFDATIESGISASGDEVLKQTPCPATVLVSVLTKGPYEGGEVCGGVEVEAISCGILNSTLFMLD